MYVQGEIKFLSDSRRYIHCHCKSSKLWDDRGLNWSYDHMLFLNIEIHANFTHLLSRVISEWIIIDRLHIKGNSSPLQAATSCTKCGPTDAWNLKSFQPKGLKSPIPRQRSAFKRPQIPYLQTKIRQFPGPQIWINLRWSLSVVKKLLAGREKLSLNQSNATIYGSSMALETSSH